MVATSCLYSVTLSTLLAHFVNGLGQVRPSQTSHFAGPSRARAKEDQRYLRYPASWQRGYAAGVRFGVGSQQKSTPCAGAWITLAFQFKCTARFACSLTC